MGIGMFFLWLFNFGISWLNAWSVGRSWIESKREGGFTHFVTWCGAVMSASGFTWCYLFVLAYMAGQMPYHGRMLLAPRYVQGMIELGYVLIIFPVLGSGIGITISSWQNYRRDRSLMSGGIAAYNTFANIYNTVEAIRVLPGIFHDLGDLFTDSKDDDTKSQMVMIMIFLTILALLGGILTTTAIIKHTARVRAFQVRDEIAFRKDAVRA